MDKKGRLIVIEGLDGSGKSTQVKKLREWLSAKADGLTYIHFPRYDAPLYGPMISRFLRGEYGGLDAVHPQLVALLYAEDQGAAGAEIRSALDAGGTVLLDRYAFSNVAYQCAKVQDPAKREELRDWILDTEYGHFGIPRPDVNIFLDVPISFVERKLAAHRKGGDRDYLGNGQDINEADMEFQKAVRERYLDECRRDAGFVRIDCSGKDGSMLPPDDIFSMIIRAIGE